MDLATGAVAAAQALAPEIRARAREGERLRTMPADLADRIEAAGLFALWLPRSLGGLELDPATIVRIIDAEARTRYAKHLTWRAPATAAAVAQPGRAGSSLLSTPEDLMAPWWRASTS